MDWHTFGTAPYGLRDFGGLSARFSLCYTGRLPLSQSTIVFLELGDQFLGLGQLLFQFLVAWLAILGCGDGYRCCEARLLFWSRFFLDGGLGFRTSSGEVARR